MSRPIIATVGDTSALLTLIQRRLALFDGQVVEVRIGPYKATRSQRANAYYWSVVLELLAKDQEMTPEEMHDAMCEKFLPNERKRVEFFNRMTGESVAVETDGRRSSKLTGGPFFDFVERVREFGRTFLNVFTPDPDPAWWRAKRGPYARRKVA